MRAYQTKGDMRNIQRIAIYDMDGTIVDSSHRYRTIETEAGLRIDLDYWRENEYRAMDDGLLPLAAQYMQDLKDPSVYVVIATARVMHGPDWQFVQCVLGLPDFFISRTDGDIQSGKSLKINGLRKILNLKQFKGIPAVFYEDNVDYLKAVCDYFNITGVYIPSKQGH